MSEEAPKRKVGRPKGSSSSKPRRVTAGLHTIVTPADSRLNLADFQVIESFLNPTQRFTHNALLMDSTHDAADFEFWLRRLKQLNHPFTFASWIDGRSLNQRFYGIFCNPLAEVVETTVEPERRVNLVERRKIKGTKRDNASHDWARRYRE